MFGMQVCYGSISHLNKSQITGHHRPLLLGPVHLSCVGLWNETR